MFFFSKTWYFTPFYNSLSSDFRQETFFTNCLSQDNFGKKGNEKSEQIVKQVKYNALIYDTLLSEYN